MVVFFAILVTTAGFHALLLSSDGNQMGFMQAGTYLGTWVASKRGVYPLIRSLCLEFLDGYEIDRL